MTWGGKYTAPKSAAFGGSLGKPKKPWQVWQGNYTFAKPTATGQSSQTSQDPAQAGPPLDPALAAQQAAANLGIALGGAWDTYKTGQINTDYGNLDNPAADAVSNPYSQAALALKRYNESQAGTLNSYAAQGQLYSGALQNASEANTGNYLQGLDALRKSKRNSLDQITEGAISRYSQVGANLDSAGLASLMKQLGLG